MKNTFWHHILGLFLLLANATNTFAVPAPRTTSTVIQPDGTELSIRLRGDEFFHFTESEDGYILKLDDKGFYTYAIPDLNDRLIASKIIARNTNNRTVSDQIFLKTIKPGFAYAEIQESSALNKRIQRAVSGRSALRSGSVIPAGLINNYPKTGSPKSLVILVNFSDLAFEPANTGTVFNNMLNQAGYNQNFHVGSVRDYYKYNSSGIFTPDFVVVGPVTLSKSMSYYGANNSDGDDTHPAQMVKEACEKIDNLVNFADFDYDQNGYVDNIYVFYAGKGEADGGTASSIWPHSYALSGENLSLTLDGKKINDYACSAEQSGSGARTGIGTFVHEYGHILGLPDFYDADYDVNGEGFDLGEWSLMASGSYNGRGCVPPCLSVLERKLLEWATPTVLNDKASITMTDFGSTNMGFEINTNNSGEFYLLENRQLNGNSWDAYLPWHGMLVYHIDMRSDVKTTVNFNGKSLPLSYADLWTYDIVNAVAAHQCADLEEADNNRTKYYGNNSSAYLASLKGDPFPGTSNVKSFTDATTPSMITWGGTILDKPLSSIVEQNGVISLDFKGGLNFNIPPIALPAESIKPYEFTAEWSVVNFATGYYLDVYTLDITNTDTITTYLLGYNNLLVNNTFMKISAPNDLTTYYYRVRATNGYATTDNSGIQSVTTTDGTPKALPATNIGPFVFTANWELKNWATGYYLDVYKIDTLSGIPTITYLDGLENRYLTDNYLVINELDDQSNYHYQIRATTGFDSISNSSVGFVTTVNSNVINITTSKASAILPFVKNRIIYLMGMDRGSMVKICDPTGTLRYTTSSNRVSVKNPGIYLIETFFDGKRKIIKLMVP